MENLINELRKETKNNFLFQLSKIETEEGLNHSLKRWGKSYKGNNKQVKEKFKRFLKGYYLKRLNAEINKIEEVNKAEEFSGELILTVEWKKSYMWGMNPKVSTNYGFIGSSVGGCGYDKLSTSTAEGLNSDLRILKLMYLKKNEELKNKKETYKEQNGEETTSERGINHFCFGYGSGYGILPYFEGGVGVSSHENICKRLGLNMRCITSTKNTDVYLISKQD